MRSFGQDERALATPVAQDSYAAGGWEIRYE